MKKNATPSTNSHIAINKSKTKGQKSTSSSQKPKSQKVKKSSSKSPKSKRLSQSLKPKTKKSNIKRTILKMTDKDKTILKNTFNNITDYLCPGSPRPSTTERRGAGSRPGSASPYLGGLASLPQQSAPGRPGDAPEGPSGSTGGPPATSTPSRTPRAASAPPPLPATRPNSPSPSR